MKGRVMSNKEHEYLCYLGRENLVRNMLQRCEKISD